MRAAPTLFPLLHFGGGWERGSSDVIMLLQLCTRVRTRVLRWLASQNNPKTARVIDSSQGGVTGHSDSCTTDQLDSGDPPASLQANRKVVSRKTLKTALQANRKTASEQSESCTLKIN